MLNKDVSSLLLSQDVDLSLPEEGGSILKWKSEVFSNLACYDSWLDKAMAGGFLSDRMAYVFLSGYQAALHAKFPMLSADKLGAFCVSEEGGNRPKAILTSFQKEGGNYKLNGIKTFVTCAEDADELLVAAFDSALASPRPAIKIFHIDAAVEGACIEEDKTLPFMPELKRGRLTLDGCMCSAASLLEGDGYADYIKPFSPLEALYVMAAGVSYMMRLARLYQWPDTFVEQCFALLISIEGASFCEPETVENQIFISGLKEQIKALVIMTENPGYWAESDPDVYKRWLRDKVMLMMPDRAHSIRLERAWQNLRHGSAE
ncbi:MAG: hypothetical protein JKY01_11010 [Pseudomonadales bacterium]|nr:hypothetical protein [Pseudomonadales bacterium]